MIISHLFSLRKEHVCRHPLESPPSSFSMGVTLNSPLKQHFTHEYLDLDDYGLYITDAMSEAWKLAQDNVRRAQGRQKRQHDKKA